MLTQTLTTANASLSILPCCKTDGSVCDCVSSLNADYTQRPDSYDCAKKMGTYVLKYGPAYASEIYGYLVASNFKSKIDLTRPLNICSLGCGYSPEYFAIKKYLQDNNINLVVNYVGIDKSQCWQNFRPVTNECTYYQHDLSLPFQLHQNPDMVIVGKVYSTLYRNNRVASAAFINNLQQLVSTNFNSNTALIFVDVNHQAFGRDSFHNAVNKFLPKFNQYYFNEPGCYSQVGWVPIPPSGLAFCVPPNLNVGSINKTGKTVIFEYMR